jgi:hypothetical protein
MRPSRRDISSPGSGPCPRDWSEAPIHQAEDPPRHLPIPARPRCLNRPSGVHQAVKHPYQYIADSEVLNEVRCPPGRGSRGPVPRIGLEAQLIRFGCGASNMRQVQRRRRPFLPRGLSGLLPIDTCSQSTSIAGPVLVDLLQLSPSEVPSDKHPFQISRTRR